MLRLCCCCLIILNFFLTSADGREQKLWKGHLNGKVVTQTDLQDILQKHLAWLRMQGDGVRASFAGADFRHIELPKANLYGADMRGSWLRQADLAKADLSMADFSKGEKNASDLRRVVLTGACLHGAIFKETDLEHALLQGADLSEADLSRAYLHSAKMENANLYSTRFCGADLNSAGMKGALLKRADLTEANLSKADLTGADLTGATLNSANASNANFTKTKFEPKAIEGIIIAGANGLSSLEFNDPSAVVELRSKARQLGFRNEERALSAALKKYQRRAGNWSADDYILLGFLTDYGASPWNLFIWLVGVILLFVCVYRSLCWKYKDPAEWLVEVPRILDLVRNSQETKQSRLDEDSMALGSAKCWGLSVLFSLQSAFNIGWGDLQIGSWLKRLIPREVAIQPLGWARVVSGIESLICLYLLVIWFVTYFGRPFE